MDLQVRALLAGVAWGIWPLFLNKSGLNGNVSSAVYTFFVLLCVLPFALAGIGSNTLAGTKWMLVIASALFGAAGLLLFNGMLAKATSENLGTLFIMMIVVQTAIPAAYQVVMNGRPSLSKIIGLAAAFVAAVLLSK
jgi:hypothetical protein